MTNSEPDFEEHLAETNEAVQNALNELAEVRAYTLKDHEIKDFKAAQYALRNLAPDKDKHNVGALYRDGGPPP